MLRRRADGIDDVWTRIDAIDAACRRKKGLAGRGRSPVKDATLMVLDAVAELPSRRGVAESWLCVVAKVISIGESPADGASIISSSLLPCGGGLSGAARGQAARRKPTAKRRGVVRSTGRPVAADAQRWRLQTCSTCSRSGF